MMKEIKIALLATIVSTGSFVSAMNQTDDLKFNSLTSRVVDLGDGKQNFYESTSVDKKQRKNNVFRKFAPNYFQNLAHEQNLILSDDKAPIEEDFISFETLEAIRIKNGAVLNYSSNGIIGTTITAMQNLGKVSNPLRITHSGLAFVAHPKDMYNMVVAMTKSPDHPYSSESTQLTYKAGQAVIKQLLDYHSDIIAGVSGGSPKDDFRLFSIESTGSADEVLNGLLPYTHVYDLKSVVNDYDGSVYVRNLQRKNISYSEVMAFVQTYIGRPYESLETLSELVRAVNDKNLYEKTENVFCSELVSLFYKSMDVLPENLNASNVVPAEFSSMAGKYDLLRGIADNTDIPLKIDIDTMCCCGCLKWFGW